MTILPRFARASLTRALLQRLPSARFQLSLSAGRPYATQSGVGNGPKSSSKRQVTLANDGPPRWTDLSTGEKAVRSTEQSFNFLLVAAGIIATGGVTYFLYHEVFSPEGATNQFSRAVSRVKQDERCVELLGDPKKIKAYGEPTNNRWARNRPISSREVKDRVGNEHLYVHFYVDGPLNKGTVNLHMIRRPSEREYDYQTLSVDIKGHSRIYLENADARPGATKKGFRLFGARWW
ncbi:uncharacterized protein K452DRAFT_228524 [Aplosporella prunicola CBS 121167]|uniref:Mitochondrial import inner membrane translocase subunit Tim21 n=1 Tax=Aplosporella prunicola CBS 121167 TaxID=1176127 RepID=A0A6A6BB45_9PEZI|nr:uncharacterized protein K452DRAFT_228524 [Aplosporella prunicola CBS 121167]KAF2141429.1 hypothetical protein K452DRAFT_228524 [Aplosporella prunicola CBS 121167]